MDIFDNEIEIIQMFQDIAPSSVKFAPTPTPEGEALYWSINDEEEWALWCNSSGKADPPPDFYSNAHGYMMDVMRVDDTAFVTKKGKR